MGPSSLVRRARWAAFLGSGVEEIFEEANRTAWREAVASGPQRKQVEFSPSQRKRIAEVRRAAAQRERQERRVRRFVRAQSLACGWCGVRLVDNGGCGVPRFCDPKCADPCRRSREKRIAYVTEAVEWTRAQLARRAA